MATVRWISLAAVVYVLVGLGFYFFGFPLFKKLNELSSRFATSLPGGRSAPTSTIFEPPQSRPLAIFFKGLGIFLVLAGVTFFLLKRHVPARRP
jgi:hypothetical protein